MTKNNPGVFETGWAGQDGASTNDYIGCKNNCSYCYAKIQAIRRKLVADQEEWKKPRLNKYRNNRKIKKLEGGRYMYPTTHDITEENVSICMKTILDILEVGNHILIVSKPRLAVIDYITRRIILDKDKVEFRFSIGSMRDLVLSKFEPNAPHYNERKEALKLAYSRGFKTSISIEPYLDEYPEFVIMDLEKYVTETIWIGTMNHLKEAKALNKEIETLGFLYVPERVKWIKDKLDDFPTKKIRYKTPFLNKLKELEK